MLDSIIDSRHTWYKNHPRLRNFQKHQPLADVGGVATISAVRDFGDRLWSIPGQLTATTLVAGCWDKTIYGLSASTLAVVWEVKTQAAVYSSPAVLSDGSFVIGCEDGRLRRVSSTGELLWQVVSPRRPSTKYVRL
jgi:outer membrane protein assembly factor BamB